MMMMMMMILSYFLLLVTITPHSFIPRLKPSFSANPSRRSLRFLLPGLPLRIPRGQFTDASEHTPFATF